MASGGSTAASRIGLTAAGLEGLLGECVCGLLRVTWQLAQEARLLLGVRALELAGLPWES